MRDREIDQSEKAVKGDVEPLALHFGADMGHRKVQPRAVCRDGTADADAVAEAWRESDEIEGRTLMRSGNWLL